MIAYQFFAVCDENEKTNAPTLEVQLSDGFVEWACYFLEGFQCLLYPILCWEKGPQPERYLYGGDTLGMTTELHTRVMHEYCTSYVGVV